MKEMCLNASREISDFVCFFLFDVTGRRKRKTNKKINLPMCLTNQFAFKGELFLYSLTHFGILRGFKLLKKRPNTHRQTERTLFVIERERVTGDLEMNSLILFLFPSLSALCFFPHHHHISSSFSSSSSPDFGSISTLHGIF